MSPSTNSASSQMASSTPTENLMELTAFAKKLPKRKCGTSAADARALEVAHVAMQKVISILQKKPEWVLDVLGELELKMHTKTTVQDEEKRFDDQVTTLTKLPTQWWAGWLQNLSGCKLTDDLLAKMLVQDSACIDKLVRFATQLAPGTVLPQSLNVCKLAARAFDERSRSLGSPFSSVWVTNHIAKDATISWGKGGAVCVSFGA